MRRLCPANCAIYGERGEGECEREKGTEMEQDGRERETTGKEVKGRRQGIEGTLPANQPSSRPNLF